MVPGQSRYTVNVGRWEGGREAREGGSGTLEKGRVGLAKPGNILGEVAPWWAFARS